MASNDELYTKRIDGPRQDLSDAYSLPANFLEIEVINPETHGVGWRQRHTDYEIKLKVFLFISFDVCCIFRKCIINFLFRPIYPYLKKKIHLFVVDTVTLNGLLMNLNEIVR